ncbi:MAG TPA: bifunctional UDP-4-keto-pentose/UDP-xylose synthase [Rickettsiales bacterium]|nr:bifunctional UDP-4-keto-pentose/UDP-xylose synthase [Rickettsiales bacterium]
MKILILGANGFIGSNLIEHIVANRPDWQITALDIATDKLGDLVSNPRVGFIQADMRESRAWIADQVKQVDVVLPLVAIATPATYVSDPISVFELDFEANLAVVRDCVKYKKRLIFPSTSEVYGMSDDLPYDEEESRLVTGPIHKQRWIYSCSKQMMDRVIYAYGARGDLQFTLFRPFNWMGPKLDNVWSNKGKSSRVVSQFLSDIFHDRDIQIVGDGSQRRCFLYIDDAIEAMMKIIENKDGVADSQIFNIGCPENEASIMELAQQLLAAAKSYPEFANVKTQIRTTTADAYYGKGYQDVDRRVPSVKKANTILDWHVKTSFADALKKTVDYYISNKPAAEQSA